MAYAYLCCLTGVRSMKLIRFPSTGQSHSGTSDYSSYGSMVDLLSLWMLLISKANGLRLSLGSKWLTLVKKKKKRWRIWCPKMCHVSTSVRGEAVLLSCGGKNCHFLSPFSCPFPVPGGSCTWSKSLLFSDLWPQTLHAWAPGPMHRMECQKREQCKENNGLPRKPSLWTRCYDD